MITEVRVQYDEPDMLVAPSPWRDRVNDVKIASVYIGVSQTHARRSNAARAEEAVAGRVMLDYAADGQLIGVEVLG